MEFQCFFFFFEKKNNKKWWEGKDNNEGEEDDERYEVREDNQFKEKTYIIVNGKKEKRMQS